MEKLTSPKSAIAAVILAASQLVSGCATSPERLNANITTADKSPVHERIYREIGEIIADTTKSCNELLKATLNALKEEGFTEINGIYPKSGKTEKLSAYFVELVEKDAHRSNAATGHTSSVDLTGCFCKPQGHFAAVVLKAGDSSGAIQQRSCDVE